MQVDGFRFDIMSCLMVSSVEKARDRLRALTLEQHGVDGSKVVLYGEGWEFGEARSLRPRLPASSAGRTCSSPARATAAGRCCMLRAKRSRKIQAEHPEPVHECCCPRWGAQPTMRCGEHAGRLVVHRSEHG